MSSFKDFAAFIARRITRGVLTLFLVSCMAFFVTHTLPGNPARAILGDEADVQSVAALNHKLGFDRPVPEQYLSWMRGFVSGNLGTSYRSGFPVSRLVRDAAPPTVELSVLSLATAIMLGVPLGMAAGYWRGKTPDRIVSAFSAFGLAVPSFWLGMVLIIIFGVKLNILPVYGYVKITQSVGGNLKSMILPVLSLAVLDMAVLMRFSRSGVIEVMHADYIRTARSKGLSSRVVLWRHAVKNALPVPLTVMGLIVGYTVGHVVAVEYLFSIPGLGKLAVDSVLNQEFLVVQAVMMLSACAVIVANTVVDVCYHLLDPRVRLG